LEVFWLWGEVVQGRGQAPTMAMIVSENPLFMLFNRFDVKQNGSITEQNLMKVMQKLMPAFPVAELKIRIREEAFCKDGNVMYKDFVQWLGPPPDTETVQDFAGRLAGASENEVNAVMSQLSPDARRKLQRAFDGMMPGNVSDFAGLLAGASESEVKAVLSGLSPEACGKLQGALGGVMPGNASDFTGGIAGASESEVRAALSQLSPEAHSKLDRAVTGMMTADLTAQVVQASDADLDAVISGLSPATRDRLMSAVDASLADKA